MKGESVEHLSPAVETAGSNNLSLQGAELLTRPSSSLTGAKDCRSASLPPLGFGESIDGHSYSDHEGREPQTYEDLLKVKVKSKLDREEKKQYKKEEEQMSHPVAGHSLNLTPAHDLVDSRVRVAEHDIVQQAQAGMTADELRLLDSEKLQYAEERQQNGDAQTRPGQLLARYIELVHQSAEKF